MACNGGCFCDVSTTGVNVCIKVWFAWESARGASFERRFSMGDGGLASHTRTCVVVKLFVAAKGGDVKCMYLPRG